MPIVHRTNNKVLPGNSRAVDVAKETVDRVIGLHARRYDAAFQVQGYQGILYNRKTSGLPCGCQSKRTSILPKLDTNGKLPDAVINDMITGGMEFGIKPYNTPVPRTSAYQAILDNGKQSVLEVRLGSARQSVQVQSLTESAGPTDPDIFGASRNRGGLPMIRGISDPGEELHTDVIDAEDDLEDFNFETGNFDLGLRGYTDAACPVCFGSGFVGGYLPLNGWREVINFQHPALVLPATAGIHADQDVPSITTTTFSFTLALPIGAVYIDALKLWNKTTLISFGSLKIDGTSIASEAGLKAFCDGRPHTFVVAFAEETEFTHMEIQLGLSTQPANFELPKTNKSTTQSLLENVDPFQVLMSPRIPQLGVLDIIVESTLGKCLQVNSVGHWNTKRSQILGWECEVRPVQPQELFTILPRRFPGVQPFHTQEMVIDNMNDRSNGPQAVRT